MMTKEMIRRPTDYFYNPIDVLSVDIFDHKEKLTTLKNWRKYCLLKSKSSSQELKSIYANELLQVNVAIKSLSNHADKMRGDLKDDD